MNINGVMCIKGEIHSIMTLMRLNTRWSGRDVDEGPLVQSFRRLNEYLEGIFDLREVDCVMYISPFQQVIVSEQASGPLTCAALSSLSKFVLYGFLSPHYPRAREGIGLIANSISCALFEETDWESDEVIFMKLLELSALSLRCDASALLDVDAAWDIYSTCLNIHSQYRASKILQSEAETALRHLTLIAFSRAHLALKPSSDIGSVGEDEEEIKFASLAGSISSPLPLPSSSSSSSSSYHSSSTPPNHVEEQQQQHFFSGSFGVTLLLSKIMSSLSALMDVPTRLVTIKRDCLSIIIHKPNSIQFN